MTTNTRNTPMLPAKLLVPLRARSAICLYEARAIVHSQS